MSSGGDMRFEGWRRSIVEVSIAASAASLAFAAIDAAPEPILSAIALVGIALMLTGDIGPRPPRSIAEPEPARREPWTRVRLDSALVDATSP